MQSTSFGKQFVGPSPISQKTWILLCILWTYAPTLANCMYIYTYIYIYILEHTAINLDKPGSPSALVRSLLVLHLTVRRHGLVVCILWTRAPSQVKCMYASIFFDQTRQAMKSTSFSKQFVGSSPISQKTWIILCILWTMRLHKQRTWLYP